jgi:hypothetical protein
MQNKERLGSWRSGEETTGEKISDPKKQNKTKWNKYW